MKVIKKPDVSDWSYKWTCSGCDTELMVEAQDITCRYYDGDIREPGYHSYSANCCECGCSISVPESKIPKILRVAIQKRCKCN